jgi:CheY-like chemotaxis protein
MDEQHGRPGELRGLRVLLLEDEALVSMLLEAMLEQMGCEVVGPAMRVAQAIALALTDPPPNVAILDVNVHGETAFPVADVLRERDIPFMFASGYGGAALPEAWSGTPVLQKPFTSLQLSEALRSSLGR